MSDNDMFCPLCGTKKTEPSGTYCNNCGTELFPSDTFCPSCGNRVDSPVIPNPAMPKQYNAPAYPERPPKSNTGTTVAIVILSVIIAVALGFGAYMLISNHSRNDASDVYYTEHDSMSEPLPTSTPNPPKFNRVSASSTRGYDTSNGVIVNYYPEYAVDGDITTAWTPDRSTDPVPVLTLHADTEQYVHGIRMTNGYCKSEKTYSRNRRITRVLISYSGGSKEASFGIDNYRAMLSVKLDEPVYTDYISITVLDSYYGDWKDIAISEVEVF